MEILARAEELASMAAEKVWIRPKLTDEEFAPYRPMKKESEEYKLESYDWNSYTRMLFDKLNACILSLSTDIRREYRKLYIAYKYETNIVEVNVQKEQLRLAVNAKISQIDDPKGICKNSTDKKGWGHREVEIFFNSLGDLEDIMAIINQAFKQQME